MISRRQFCKLSAMPMLSPVFPALNMLEDEPAKVEPAPSPRHLPWHQMEYYAFVHFNMNTFTGKEWGEGYEDPKLFLPEKLDCNQWASTFKSAGMKGIIITAKHHDGFCLWPSEFTNHSVKSSLWRGGKGDVLQELSAACKRFGLKFGVYLSPWDRNHPLYGTPEYNDFFKKQLREVLSNYGEIFEVWFDGANGEGPSGKKQVYDFPGFISIVRELQPNAVIFSDAGPDIRWVGNESGFSNPTCWSMLKRDEFFPGTPRYKELTSGHEDGTHWVPAECDVSIRPGWFYRDSETSRIKSVQDLMNIYYASVGRNGSLLLNVPADKNGLITPQDAGRLMEFRKARERAFGEDVALHCRVSATSLRGGKWQAGNVTSGKADRFWAAQDGIASASLTVDFGKSVTVNSVRLREEIRLGQRVEEFLVEVMKVGDWAVVARGTTIGNCRILKFPDTTAEKLRITILKSRACPTISQISAFNSAE